MGGRATIGKRQPLAQPLLEVRKGIPTERVVNRVVTPSIPTAHRFSFDLAKFTATRRPRASLEIV
jgi:hypothetical protein